jgi:exodeoxyribonuclease-3
MRIATWNVNSIRSRLEHITRWLKEARIDVLLLQELKCQNHDFPDEFFSDLGYNTAVFGQKTYNGVAIITKQPIDEVQLNIPNFQDEQARYIEAVIGTKRYVSVYVPNGSEVGSEKYDYKLRFLSALKLHIKHLLTYKEELIIGGDFNIAPDDVDVYDPTKWKDRILCSISERLKLNELLNLGYIDAFRSLYPTKKGFTWWDYRAGSFQQNKGMRIDHFLLSPEAMDKAKSVTIDCKPREWEKPSDHAPVILEMM